MASLDYISSGGLWVPVPFSGETGATGPTGMAGGVGARGLIGPAGDLGADGPAGDRGSTGPKGFQGGVGNNGPQGDRGAVGPQGAVGPSGDANQNYRMVRGSTWITNVVANRETISKIIYFRQDGNITFDVSDGYPGYPGWTGEFVTKPALIVSPDTGVIGSTVIALSFQDSYTMHGGLIPSGSDGRLGGFTVKLYRTTNTSTKIYWAAWGRIA